MYKKITLILIAIGLIGLAYFYRVSIKEFYQELTKSEVPEPITSLEISHNINLETEEKELPDEINLAVPFASQAPHANWDLPYQEACEETAALMIHRYWQNQGFDSKEDADDAILDLVYFQTNNYGAYEHSSADETVRFIKDRWGYEGVDLITGEDVTIEKIKQTLSQGFPVLVLAAGRELGNPNYRQPGPLYHALVIKGYKKDGTIITNDPGTRNGADYLYNPKVLYDAIHDWNGGDVPTGQKNMIIIYPNS